MSSKTKLQDLSVHATAESIDALYTASLKACPALSVAQRIQAEIRFCRSLENSLGGPEGVAQAYLAWCTAAQAQVMAISVETASRAHLWAEAAERARDDSLREVEHSDAMSFEVRLS